jgi:hypothetical protein
MGSVRGAKKIQRRCIQRYPQKNHAELTSGEHWGFVAVRVVDLGGHKGGHLEGRAEVHFKIRLKNTRENSIEIHSPSRTTALKT